MDNIGAFFWRELMALSREQLRRWFPHGANYANGLWYPAEQTKQKPTNTLNELLVAKGEA